MTRQPRRRALRRPAADQVARGRASAIMQSFARQSHELACGRPCLPPELAATFPRDLLICGPAIKGGIRIATRIVNALENGGAPVAVNSTYSFALNGEILPDSTPSCALGTNGLSRSIASRLLRPSFEE